jgi:hypothetical protein
MKHLEKTNCKKIDINYYHAQTPTPKKNLKHARVNTFYCLQRSEVELIYITQKIYVMYTWTNVGQ